MFDKDNPKLGIYSITNEDYHAAAGFSRTQLMHLDKSPYHFWYNVLSGEAEKPKDTPSKVIGNAFHTLLLEPNLFDKEYIIKPRLEQLPEKVLMKDVGKEQYEQVKQARNEARERNLLLVHEFDANRKNKIIITEAEFAKVSKMVEMVKRHDIVDTLLKDAVYEKSIFWNDPETGILFKARPDIWSSKMVVDLKTITDVAEYKLKRSALDYGYYLQAGMMYEGCKVLGKPFDVYTILAVEKELPYAPAPFILDDFALQYGIDQFQKYKDMLAKCIKEKKWDGYPIRELNVAEYITKKLEAEL